MKNVQGFCGTARKSGFDGDIVLATHPHINNGIKKYLQDKRVTVYGLDVKCKGSNPTEVCTLASSEFKTNAVPIAMLRFYIYQWWALQYEETSVIMLSDFRDVFFQANPFAYKYPECKIYICLLLTPYKYVTAMFKCYISYIYCNYFVCCVLFCPSYRVADEEIQ